MSPMIASSATSVSGPHETSVHVAPSASADARRCENGYESRATSTQSSNVSPAHVRW